MKYKIFAGLVGGFNNVEYQYTEDFDTQEEAEQAAFEAACVVYEDYVGMHGLRSTSDIINEDLGCEEYEDCSERELQEIAEEIFCEERESWLGYYVEIDNEQEDNNN
jgi:hypothetical protein